MNAILVATDGSQTAKEAVAFATDLAREAGAVLHVLSVRPQTFHGHGGAAVPLALPHPGDGGAGGPARSRRRRLSPVPGGSIRP